MQLPPPEEQHPVMLWAPTARNGITLLQRLITSTGDVLVFGENRMFTGFLPSAVAESMANPERRDEERKRFAGGDYAFWSSRVGPDTGAFQQWSQSAYTMLGSVFQFTANQEGYERWGVKEPQLNLNIVKVFKYFYPKSQHIFLYRDLMAVLKSYKARGWLPTPQSVADVSTQWSQNMPLLLEWAADKNADLVVKYEDLTGDGSEAMCQKIESYLGTRPIKREVLGKRVNTFTGDESKGHAPDQYIDPKALTDEERSIAIEVAGEAMKLAGYRD